MTPGVLRGARGLPAAYQTVICNRRFSINFDRFIPLSGDLFYLRRRSHETEPQSVILLPT